MNLSNSATPGDPESSRQSTPQGVEYIQRALREFDLHDELQSVRLHLGGIGCLRIDEPAFKKLFTSPKLHTLHLQSGVLLFTSCATTLMAPNQSSKIILADMALIVTPGAVEKLKPGNVMIGAVSKDAAVSLDRCTFKAEVDSPQLAYLTACVVGSGTQVTMNHCKFLGFWRVLHFAGGAQACMTDCKLDLTTSHTYPWEDTGSPVVLGRDQGSNLRMANCQLTFSCARLKDRLTFGFIHLQEGSTAELDHVTYTGRTDIGARRNAPAISMYLSHTAVNVLDSSVVHMKGCSLLGGSLSATGNRAHAHLSNCYLSGAFLCSCCMDVGGGASASLQKCTIQNLCSDTSMPTTCHSCITLDRYRGKGGALELQDCVLENMQGCGYLHAIEGKSSLTRCTLRKCAASPPSYIAPDRLGGVQLSGPATVSLDHCYVEAGLDMYATYVRGKGSLNCKNSLLWAGEGQRIGLKTTSAAQSQVSGVSQTARRTGIRGV